MPFWGPAAWNTERTKSLSVDISNCTVRVALLALQVFPLDTISFAILPHRIIISFLTIHKSHQENTMFVGLHEGLYINRQFYWIYFRKGGIKMSPCIRSSSAPLQCCSQAGSPCSHCSPFPLCPVQFLKLCKWICECNEGSKALYKELRSVIKVGILSCKCWRNLWSQIKCISHLTTHSCWQGVFLPSTFSFVV